MRKWALVAIVVALVGGATAFAVRCAPAPPELDPAAARIWTSTSGITSIAPDAAGAWMATGGGILFIDDGGETVEKLTDPDIAWREVAVGPAGVAAVGLRHVVWKAEGKWRSASLPAGVEGYSIAAGQSCWWIGHSSGVSQLDPRRGLIAERAGGPVRRMCGSRGDVWALGGDRFVRAETGEEITPPTGAKGPWVGCIREGRLLVSGGGGEDPLAIWEWQGGWRRLATIPGHGTCVTVLASGPSLVAAVARDGWFTLVRGRWRRVAGVPVALKAETSALGRSGKSWIAGTRNAGAWRLNSARFQPLDVPSDMPAANLQSLARFNGLLYASTFNRGLLIQDGERWETLDSPDGPQQPRQLLAIPSALLVREADGTLSTFNGESWQRNVLRHRLKRSWIGSMSLTPNGIALGGWGSIALGSFEAPTHPEKWREFPLPAPWTQRGISTMAWSRGSLYLGTGKDGAFRFDPETGANHLLNGGPSDPWVTALLPVGDRVLAGAAGGRIGFADERKNESDLVAGITALAAMPSGAVVATRDGIQQLRAGKWRRITCPPVDALEPQCLLAEEAGLWIGGRNGLVFVPVGLER